MLKSKPTSQKPLNLITKWHYIIDELVDVKAEYNSHISEFRLNQERLNIET